MKTGLGPSVLCKGLLDTMSLLQRLHAFIVNGNVLCAIGNHILDHSCWNTDNTIQVSDHNVPRVHYNWTSRHGDGDLDLRWPYKSVLGQS